MVRVSGIGSWPGTDVRAALQAIRDDLAEIGADGVSGMPYLPELPARGPGSDPIGRSAHLLHDLPVDLQPQGWRLVDRPGMDAFRTSSLWRQDMDELAEVFDGDDREFKVQVVGPWTLASELWLPLGDRVLSDPGAVRDLGQSLGAGIAEHLTAVRRLLPRAAIVVQLDEPALPRVLAGRVPSASGYRRLAAPEPDHAAALLRSVLRSATSTERISTVLHCPAPRPPLQVMREAGPTGISIDVTQLDAHRWEGVAVAVEAGVDLWAGVLKTDEDPAAYRVGHDRLASAWRDVGLTSADLSRVSLTPTSGLAPLDPESARALTAATVLIGRDLAETAVQ
ncbi:MAG: methionine synthase [Ornithinimicrobium sp.]